MAGGSTRFRNKGFNIPKQFIVVDDKQLIDYSFDCIDLTEYEHIIFIILKEHVTDYHIDEILRNKYGNKISIVILPELTEGCVQSCLAAKALINNDYPLVIHNLDIWFSPTFRHSDIPRDSKGELPDGFLPLFRSNSTNYSYAEINERGEVLKTEEKKVISPYAICGIYCYKSGRDFVHHAEQMIALKYKTNNEYYMAPLYNLIIQNGGLVKSSIVDKMHVIGTPEEMEFFRQNVSLKRDVRPIALCSDHSGFELKEWFKQWLEALGVKYIDFGTYTAFDCDYVDFVWSACSHIKRGFCNYGIGFCRSGQGVNICANKVKDIRGALVFNQYMAEYAVRHNCANFFSIPTKFVEKTDMTGIYTAIQKNTFDGGRHAMRVRKIDEVCGH